MKTKFYTTTIKFLVLFALTISSLVATAQTFRIFDPGLGGPPFGNPSGGTAGSEANLNVGVPIQTGIRFRVVQAGTISAIHFYKGNTNVSAHTVNLWRINGTNLGTATLPADAVSGWRSVTLPAPVPVVPGVTYVASVFTATGIISATNGGLSSDDYSGRTGFIIIGGENSVADPVNAGNGVFDLSGSAATFPSAVQPTNWNYWVDVQFTSTFPLPARLTEFNASTDNHNVTLTWKTASEQNNKGFEILRSNNGADWYAVNFVKGAGESNEIKSYNYVDKALAPGTYYYKLNQTDFDGKTAASNIVSVTISGKGSVLLSVVGPNPFRGSTSIRFDLPVKQKVRLSVFDLQGREVKVLADNIRDQGSHQVILNADGLSPQVYVVRLQSETETIVKQVVLQ